MEQQDSPCSPSPSPLDGETAGEVKKTSITSCLEMLRQEDLSEYDKTQVGIDKANEPETHFPSSSYEALKNSPIEERVDTAEDENCQPQSNVDRASDPDGSTFPSEEQPTEYDFENFNVESESDSLPSVQVEGDGGNFLSLAESCEEDKEAHTSNMSTIVDHSLTHLSECPSESNKVTNDDVGMDYMASQQDIYSHGDVSITTDAPVNASLTTEHQNLSMQESSQVSTCPQNDAVDLNTENSLPYDYFTNTNRSVLSSVSHVECLASSTACFQQSNSDNFLKGCKWSPDGNQIMTNSHDNHLRIFSFEDLVLPTDISLEPTCVIREKSQVYDYCWYPAMTPISPESCRVACTCSNIPIHLWNSNTGETVSSYLAYDHCDEITAAYSLAFSPDGSKLFAGYKKAIRIFDTARPGRTCKLLKTYDPHTKEGIRGIISCFAFSQDSSPVFVAGSYSRHGLRCREKFRHFHQTLVTSLLIVQGAGFDTVSVYDYNSQQLIYVFLQGQQGGVTHVMISPDGTKLYTGGRKDPEIVCWDMRNPAKVLFTCLRDVQTNQRIYFDLAQDGQNLVSGNHDGSVNVWNTLDPGETINGEIIIKPCLSFLAHRDCVNGVSFNDQRGILATASGRRHFMNFDNYDSDSSSMSVEEEVSDNSLKFWNIPRHSQNSSLQPSQ